MNSNKKTVLRWSAVAIASLAAACAATSQPDVIALKNTFEQALNTGDFDQALAKVSDDIVFTGTPRCTDLTPCAGKAQYLEHFLKWAQGTGVKIRYLDSGHPLGDATRVKMEVTSDTVQKLGVQRIVGYEQMRVKNGLLVEQRFIPDPTDPQTAAYMRGMAAMATAAVGNAQ